MNGVYFAGVDELIKGLEKRSHYDVAAKDAVKKRTAELNQLTQRFVPVRTGHLRRSIRQYTSSDKMEGRVKAHAEYALAVEKGTRRFSGRYYMRRAFNIVKPKFLADMRKALK